MATLSISRAWEEGAAFAAREFRLLFPIAFLFLALPAIVLNLVMPQDQSPEMYQMAEWVRRNGIGIFLLITILIALVQLVLNMFGNLALTFLALRPGTSVSESFRAAGRRLPAVLGAVLLVVVAVVALLFVPLWLLASSGGGDQVPGSSGELSPGLALIPLIIMLLFLALAARLLPVTAVGVAEQLGPVRIIRRSWQLTKGHFWKLFGSLLLLGLVYVIMSAAVGAVIGLFLIGTGGSPTISTTGSFILSLVGGLLASIVSVFTMPFFARIYAQLSGRVGEVGEVFR